MYSVQPYPKSNHNKISVKIRYHVSTLLFFFIYSFVYLCLFDLKKISLGRKRSLESKSIKLINAILYSAGKKKGDLLWLGFRTDF